MQLTWLLILAMQAYHLRHWDALYETAETRRVRTLTYYSKPNKLVGEGVGHMLMQPDGLALYGTWTFLEALASTAPQNQRGWLIRNGTPMDAQRMSALTRIPMKEIERALTFFSTPPLDWLEVSKWDHGHAQGTPIADHGHAQGTPIADHGHAQGTPIADHGHAQGTPWSVPTRGKKEDKETEVLKRERRKGGFASEGEAAQGQVRQFAAIQAVKGELEAVDPERRTLEQEEELKKLRGQLRAIQQKQAAGDFTPLTEEPA